MLDHHNSPLTCELNWRPQQTANQRSLFNEFLLFLLFMEQ